MVTDIRVLTWHLFFVCLFVCLFVAGMEEAVVYFEGQHSQILQE